MPISLGNGLNGFVDPGNWVRDELVDAALIEPRASLPDTPSSRVIVTLGDADQKVVMIGAMNHGTIGAVEARHFSGNLKNGEFIHDHFLVRPAGATFAEPGDSGGAVVLETNRKHFVGQLRAVDETNGKAAVTRMTAVAGKMGEFII